MKMRKKSIDSDQPNMKTCPSSGPSCPEKTMKDSVKFMAYIFPGS